jgi:hypothetical protein
VIGLLSSWPGFSAVCDRSGATRRAAPSAERRIADDRKREHGMVISFSQA